MERIVQSDSGIMQWNNLVLLEGLILLTELYDLDAIQNACPLSCSIWAKSEGTIQTEAEGGREEKQSNAKEKRRKHHYSLQKEGFRAYGYASLSHWSSQYMNMFFVFCVMLD